MRPHSTILEGGTGSVPGFGAGRRVWAMLGHFKMCRTQRAFGFVNRSTVADGLANPELLELGSAACLARPTRRLAKCHSAAIADQRKKASPAH